MPAGVEGRAYVNLMKSKNHRGFSLLEMLAAMGISLTLAGITVMAFVPVFKSQSVNTAYNDTLTTLRRARDQAAGDMRTYVVTFTLPGTITVQQSISVSGTCQIPPTGNVLITTVLPSDITFHVEPGVPTSNTVAPMTPDQFGTAGFAVDFDEPNTPGTATICFNPDGTASDTLGNVNNGVVYLGRPGDLYSSRAITLWGTTGRLRGWRLYKNAGINSWSQQ
jgi:prepilin-type N-terminal cleavage/methylation domain-containing protein